MSDNGEPVFRRKQVAGIIDAVLRKIETWKKGPAPLPAGEEINRAVDKNMNILVVDDHVLMIRIISHLLQQLDFVNIDQALDGKAALEKMSAKSYGLVLSDWSMAPMGGLDFLRELRSKGNRIPFIMVSAESKAENVIAALDAGVSDYIVKPFNADTFKTKLSQVLGGLI
jgi:two-component system chemotaxis response regulator CheY